MGLQQLDHSNFTLTTFTLKFWYTLNDYNMQKLKIHMSIFKLHQIESWKNSNISHWNSFYSMGYKLFALHLLGFLKTYLDVL
jgi:hypothetical protein